MNPPEIEISHQKISDTITAAIGINTPSSSVLIPQLIEMIAAYAVPFVSVESWMNSTAFTRADSICCVLDDHSVLVGRHCQFMTVSLDTRKHGTCHTEIGHVLFGGRLLPASPRCTELMICCFCPLIIPSVDRPLTFRRFKSGACVLRCRYVRLFGWKSIDRSVCQSGRSVS